jgi:hypothetical protein
MSNANKIIKENDLVQLLEKIETLDLGCLMRITNKGVYKCRKKSFLFMYEYSKKFSNDPQYVSLYIMGVLKHAASNNFLYVLELLINDKDFILTKNHIEELAKNSTHHYRIFNYFINNYSLSKCIYYEAISMNLLREKDKVDNKKMELIMNSFTFNSNEFLEYLISSQSYQRSNTTYYDYLSFLDFLKKYDEEKIFLKNTFPFESFMINSEKDEFKKYLIEVVQEKIDEF